MGYQGSGAQAVERRVAGHDLVGRNWRSRTRELRLLSRNGGLETKLELCFGSAEECLVDLGLVRVEDDVRSRRVGVALEDDMLIGLDLEDVSKLQRR